MLNTEFLQILACPLCKGKLEYQPEEKRLICRAERLSFIITDDGIPVLLAEEAVPLSDDDDK